MLSFKKFIATTIHIESLHRTKHIVHVVNIMLNFVHTDVWRNFVALNKSTGALINRFHGVKQYKNLEETEYASMWPLIHREIRDFVCFYRINMGAR